MVHQILEREWFQRVCSLIPRKVPRTLWVDYQAVHDMWLWVYRWRGLCPSLEGDYSSCERDCPRYAYSDLPQWPSWMPLWCYHQYSHQGLADWHPPKECLCQRGWQRFHHPSLPKEADWHWILHLDRNDHQLSPSPSNRQHFLLSSRGLTLIQGSETMDRRHQEALWTLPPDEVQRAQASRGHVHIHHGGKRARVEALLEERAWVL